MHLFPATHLLLEPRIGRVRGRKASCSQCAHITRRLLGGFRFAGVVGCRRLVAPPITHSYRYTNAQSWARQKRSLSPPLLSQRENRRYPELATASLFLKLPASSKNRRFWSVFDHFFDFLRRVSADNTISPRSNTISWGSIVPGSDVSAR